MGWGEPRAWVGRAGWAGRRSSRHSGLPRHRRCGCAAYHALCKPGPQRWPSLLRCPAQPRSPAALPPQRTDLYPLALLDEQRHLDDGAGLQRGRLAAARLWCAAGWARRGAGDERAPRAAHRSVALAPPCIPTPQAARAAALEPAMRSSGPRRGAALDARVGPSRRNPAASRHSKRGPGKGGRQPQRRQLTAVLPLTPGSVSTISSSTVLGGSTEMTLPFHSSTPTVMPSFRYLRGARGRAGGARAQGRRQRSAAEGVPSAAAARVPATHARQHTAAAQRAGRSRRPRSPAPPLTWPSPRRAGCASPRRRSCP